MFGILITHAICLQTKYTSISILYNLLYRFFRKLHFIFIFHLQIYTALIKITNSVCLPLPLFKLFSIANLLNVASENVTFHALNWTLISEENGDEKIPAKTMQTGDNGDGSWIKAFTNPNWGPRHHLHLHPKSHAYFNSFCLVLKNYEIDASWAGGYNHITHLASAGAKMHPHPTSLYMHPNAFQQQQLFSFWGEKRWQLKSTPKTTN